MELAAGFALGLKGEDGPRTSDGAQLEELRRERDLYGLLYDALVEKLRRTM